MASTLSSFWDQTFFIPSPAFTAKNLPDQTGKIILITGGYAGIGLSLAQILYSKNATLYLAGRSASKATIAIDELRRTSPTSTGRLEFLPLDLADLTTIKPAAQQFLAQETRLDVLVNNAGVMNPPAGSVSAQGHELQIAVNVYAPWLFTQFLLPILKSTVQIPGVATGSVRVIWAASFAIDAVAPKGGVLFDEETGLARGDLGREKAYGQSKAGNVMLGVEGARRWGKDGILSLSFNPGNLQTELLRHTSVIQKALTKVLMHPVEMGALTELYAGWSPDIAFELNGSYIVPWGRIGRYNKDLEEGIANGNAEKLWKACGKVAEDFL
ncbi:hypothetical protein B0J11DRAFT_594735 [Dendryphion nanum]|uniref:NAD(P)-binding protein n=1 Tax=Dendryphion nanum TaxID=256645 RepID=A0A9P9D7Y0_9PLEO|nr:hypothetical protein B0J11DRAFT_594735 [Dendryphion nanum]